MESILYTVKGTPIAWARCAPGHKGQLYDTQKHIKNVYRIGIESQHGRRPMYTGPLGLVAKFVFPMPKYKMKHWESLNDTPHTNTPDSSNLLKFLEDAIVGLLIPDDRIIANIQVSKMYGFEPRTEFKLIEIE
jgi:Holliday junction resolvase RusA-like endonuclease